MALAFGAAVAPRALAQGRSIVIPLSGDMPQIVLPVSIEGRQAMAVLDNGAPVSWVDLSYSNVGPLLMRDPSTGAVLTASANAPAEQIIGRVRRIRLDSTLQIPTLQAGDLSGVSGANERRISALVGMELFRDNVVDVDLSAGSLTVTSGQAGEAPEGGRSLDLTASAESKHLVEIAVEDLPPFKAIVDLGSATPLILAPKLAARLGLIGKRTPATHLTTMAGDGGSRRDVTVRTGSLARVRFAGTEFTDAPFDVCELPSGEAAGEALLGLPFLSRFDLRFDLGRNRMWVLDTPRANIAFDRNLTGLQTARTPAGLRIIHVADSSPALAAGFSVNEVIVAIDGGLPGPRGLQGAHAGQVMSLTLAGGPTRNLTPARFY